MTSPVSAVEAIEKTMREAAENLVDTLVLERETNGQSKEFSDWAVFMVMRAFKVQRADVARQAEALERSLRELTDAGTNVLNGLDARIQSAPRNAVPVFYGIVDLSDALNSARALLGGENAGN